MNLLFDIDHPGEVVHTRRIINTPSDFAKKTLFYVQETGYTKSIKSHMSKRSNLSSYLFIFVLSGKGSFAYQSQIYELSQYDCVLVDCMETYAHQSYDNSPWELLWVHFNGAAAKEYYQYFINNCTNIFHSDSPDVFIQLIYQVMETVENKRIFWEIMASKLITDVLTNCILFRQSNQSNMKEPTNDKLDAIRDYLELHFSDKLLLDDISSHFYISKFHMSREFKRIYGITILDYLTMKRINHAKAQLRFTELSIENIATESGYPDASYFNKVFQKLEAMTASEYRKKWRG